MKKIFNMYLAGALLCAAALFTVVACEKDEEKAKPGKAGISVVNETDNVCGTEAEPFVILGVTAENATSYKWYKNGTALSGTGTGEALTVSESGTYTAAGVNDQGEGAVSDAKIVTIANCGAPVIAGADHNDCGEGETTVELTIEAIATATSYKWYKDDAPIDGATTTTYTVEEPGTYTVAGVYASGEGAKSAPKVVDITSCRAPIPGAAGTIDGLTENVCPEETVELTIGAIENATSYKWYRNDAKIDGESSQTLTVTQTGDYTVAGVNNDLEEGTRSETHHVTITSCVPAKPNAPQGPGGRTTNNCDQQEITLQIFTSLIIQGATTVTWYELEEGGSSVSVKTSAQDVDGSRSYDVETSGTYVVQGSNEWYPEGGPVSDPIVVTITECDPLTIVPQGTPVILVNSGVFSNVFARDCGANKIVELNLDNLKNPGAEGIAGGLPITGALSYTWYIYRADAPTTPVEVETDTGNGYYDIQLRLTEGGTYTVVARNDIGPGEESAPVVIEWITCPAAAPEWSGAGDVSGCTSSTVELQVTLPIRNAPGTYVWYKDGNEVARQTGDNRNKYTVTDTEGGVYTVAAVDSEGEGVQNTGRTVTFGDCTLSSVAFNDFNYDGITFDVYDNIGTNMANGAPAQYTVTVKKGAMPVGNPVVITGLGNTGYETATLTLSFDEGKQELSVASTGKDFSPISYGANAWYNGAAMVNEIPIKATAKKVGGKIYIYIQSSSMPAFAYSIWSDAEGDAAAVLLSTGVNTVNHHGEDYNFATVLVQQ